MANTNGSSLGVGGKWIPSIMLFAVLKEKGGPLLITYIHVLLYCLKLTIHARLHYAVQWLVHLGQKRFG